MPVDPSSLLQKLWPKPDASATDAWPTAPGAGSAAEPEAKPHVLLVLDTFPKSLGGGERVVLRLAAMLPHYGYRVSILTFSIDPTSTFRPEHSPCPLYLLPLHKTYNLEALRGALALRRLIRQERIQLVQTFFESSDLWAGVVVRLLSSAKLIWSRRDMGILRQPKHRTAYRLLRRLPHRVHTVSEQVRRHAIEVDGAPPERVFTVHNGLDLEDFGPAQDRNPVEAPVVLTIGNIRRVKGHDILLRAAALVRKQRPEVRFLIAGEVLEPAFFQELLALADSLHLGQALVFLGGVTDLGAQLRAADLFVLPSRSEGFSNSLLEAMACSLPVVATDVGGNAEAVRAGVTGQIVPSEDPEAMAAAILNFVVDPAKRLCMGREGRRRAETEFSADSMLRKLANAYHELLILG